ncbi:hypothetical protein NKG94_34640 [Micromonospora sp. M12]
MTSAPQPVVAKVHPPEAILPDAPDPLAAEVSHSGCSGRRSCFLCDPAVIDTWPAPVTAGASRG